MSIQSAILIHGRKIVVNWSYCNQFLYAFSRNPYACMHIRYICKSKMDSVLNNCSIQFVCLCIVYILYFSFNHVTSSYNKVIAD